LYDFIAVQRKPTEFRDDCFLNPHLRRAAADLDRQLARAIGNVHQALNVPAVGLSEHDTLGHGWG
jgi:hypothetical protein